LRNYYIFKSGRLRRKDNTVFFEYFEDGKENRVVIPVEDVDSIYVFGEMELNTHLIHFFSKHHIVFHFYNYYGWYDGSFYPKEHLISGDLIVKQVMHYVDIDKRLVLAKEFVLGAIHGMINNLKRYIDKTEKTIGLLEKFKDLISEQSGISELMGIEGNCREAYYGEFTNIIKAEVEFEKRVKHPPDNMLNALISFVNGVIYAEVLKEIYRTQLNPAISYLHEPLERRFSLSLDIAEIFKPIYGDRIIFDLLNNGKLKKKHFDKDLNYAYLKEEGRKIVIQAFDEKLKTTVYHKQLKRRVSYLRIIRLELYKLIKHLLGEKIYRSFKIWH